MIHEAAAAGFAREASTYRAARPSYHPDLVARFVARYGQGTVVEVGAGTGIFTRQLVEAGLSVIAVEPVDAMRAELAELAESAQRAELAGFAAGRIELVDGTAEALPLDDASAHTIVAAQAFHWFDHARALDEAARVLRPGGHLVTVWNVRDESAPWVAAYTEVMDRHAGDTPRHRTMRWRHAIEADPRFTLVDDWHVANPRPTDPDGVVARAISTSFIAALDRTDQHEVEAALRAIVAPLGSSFDYPYRSELQGWVVDREKYAPFEKN